ncbi:hypothetical protein D1007_52485 [Hordeum vulgare]|nr:hypothetical protein D1007_52485 [Hordeum vulgare]
MMGRRAAGVVPAPRRDRPAIDVEQLWPGRSIDQVHTEPSTVLKISRRIHANRTSEPPAFLYPAVALRSSSAEDISRTSQELPPPAMGNLVPASAGGGKVVLPDGSVRAVGEAASVAELMVEHPRHFVVDARLVAAGGAKVAALPADHLLDGAGVYVVLPATRGRVSADEARRALAASPLLARCRSMPVSALERRDEAAPLLGVVGDQQPELRSQELTRSGPWKPSLKTIEERVLPRKVPHWLF